MNTTSRTSALIRFIFEGGRVPQIYWFDSSDKKAEDAVTIRLLISMIDSVIVHFARRIPPYQIGGRSRVSVL